MKAQIFYLKSQQDLCRDIESLLRDNVFKHIVVERLAISDSYSKASAAEEHENCLSYLNLLKACMVRVSDFTIVVADDRGNWGYMGNKGSKSKAPKGAKSLNLPNKSMTSAFPAIAIMDRMVMVPQGIHEAFDKSREFSWFLKPLDLQGVALVDFQDPKSVSEGVRQVGSQLKTEVVKLCRRHMLARKIPKPDFTELANLLNVDKMYLEQQQNEILVSTAKLTPRVVSGPAQLGKLSQVILEIKNESENALERIRVQVRAPSSTLKAPVAETLNFTGGEARAQRIQFEVCPKASPYCPLEVLFDLDETSQTYAAFPIPVILDVSS